MKTALVFLFALICYSSCLELQLAFQGPGVVRFTLSNPSDKVISFLKWGTPFETLFTNAFYIENIETHTVPQFYGPMLRRAEPVAEDYMTLLPTQSTSIDVNLLKYYIFTEAGVYKVDFYSHSYSNFYYNSSAYVKITQENLVQNKMYYDTLMAELTQDSMRRTTYEYVQCTATEQSQIQAAVKGAITETQTAYNCMNRRTCNELAVKWFGVYAASRYDYDMKVYNDVHNKLQSKFRGYCNPSGCSSNTYAYVYPTDTQFTVYLCRLFWTLPNERVNTIVHEMSHFNSLGQTQDYAYGQSNCLKLASSNPNQASHNADNVCYFSEEAKFLFGDS